MQTQNEAGIRSIIALSGALGLFSASAPDFDVAEDPPPPPPPKREPKRPYMRSTFGLEVPTLRVVSRASKEAFYDAIVAGKYANPMKAKVYFRNMSLPIFLAGPFTSNRALRRASARAARRGPPGRKRG